MTGTLLGLDIGSSSIKVSLVEIDSGRVIGQAVSPSGEMAISAPQPGWAEQHPDLWWEHVTRALHALKAHHAKNLQAVKAIGIAYQMHGLVLLDATGAPIRPAIIWCDSRAVNAGAMMFRSIGESEYIQRLGNAPGNFTAAKLAWVQQNEPENFRRIKHFMLPGDYIAYRLTGAYGTTPSGLSEGILWDFQRQLPALDTLARIGISPELAPPVTPNLGEFAGVMPQIARELGLPVGVPVSYRAGDQPNNALALNVLNPGELAANAGTSGVIYGVASRLSMDPGSRVNNFLHVNNTEKNPRIGVLMCVNGAGSFYRWTRHSLAPGMSYAEMNTLAQSSPIGSRGLIALPYGNGAERTLDNASIGASLESIDLNRHGQAEIFRAAQEGVVFALCYGLEIMQEMGLSPTKAKAGYANMFQSAIFQQTFATATNLPLELITTDGSEGAARGAGIGAEIMTFSDAFQGLHVEAVVEPNLTQREQTVAAYSQWKDALRRHMSK